MSEYILFENRPAVLKRQNVVSRRPPKKRFTVLLFPIALTVLLLCSVFVDSVSLSSNSENSLSSNSRNIEPTDVKPAPCIALSAGEVAELIKPHLELLQKRDTFSVKDEHGEVLWIKTSLDQNLQNNLRGLLDRSGAEAGAVVAINPTDGRILALADFGYSSDKPLLLSTVPAASIFKIITAASALENTDLNLLSKIPYNGQKYTLYWSNLSKRVTKSTNFVTLEKAFALSINPVFGKIGLYHVGSDNLTVVGEKFGFNRPLPTDLPVETSQLTIPSSSFEVAEIACGYNKVTLISPLHAAWIASVILNRGRAHSVGAVDRIEDSKGNLLYAYKPEMLQPVVSVKTSSELREMMRCTVLEGTARRSFYQWRRKIREGVIDVGGKTGHINNWENTIGYDWFVGYGSADAGEKSIVLAVVLLHGKKSGIKAHKVAQLFIQKYFHL
jgi:cell division protein FtsI/penicillin-binding protein 2